MSLTYSLPGRPSDAGPESGPPATWSELLDDAEDELRTARRCYRDTLAVQRELRIEALDRAEIAISRAREILNAQ